MPPPSPTDLRILVPRTKRAIYGPTTVDPDAEQQLTDAQVKDLIADSVAKIIFYTNGLWPFQLLVTATDTITGAASEYATNLPLKVPDQTVICNQAALDFFFYEFKDKRVTEEISDAAGPRWVYGLSANMLVAQMKQLQVERDRAIEIIVQQQDYLVDYVSFIASRDALTSALVEPWVAPGLLTLPSGQEIFPSTTFGP